MADEPKFDIWMRDPYRWEPKDGPYVGYDLNYANQTIQDVTETLLLTGYWDVAIVEAGKQPFVKGLDGIWVKAEELYMICAVSSALNGICRRTQKPGGAIRTNGP
jgi:hypothetical protein